MNNLICECENPIPQAMLSYACQKCFKPLKSYTKEYFVIVWHKEVTEVTVHAIPIESVLNVCLQALNEIGVNVTDKEIESPVINLSDEVQSIKQSILLKYIEGIWTLYYT